MNPKEWPDVRGYGYAEAVRMLDGFAVKIRWEVTQPPGAPLWREPEDCVVVRLTRTAPREVTLLLCRRMDDGIRKVAGYKTEET